MIIDQPDFAEANAKEYKTPLYVAVQAFDTAGTDLHAFTSSSIAETPAGVTVYPGTLRPPSGTLQTLDRLSGLSTIGSLQLQFLDLGKSLRDLMKSKLEAGFGLRRKQVELYVGYPDIPFSSYRLIAAQVVHRITGDGALLNIQYADAQIFQNEKIFIEEFTQLSLTLSETDTQILVQSSVNILPVEHGHSYTEHPAYDAGTISATNGSTVINGSGTVWTSARLARTHRITIEGVEYTIDRVQNDTTIYLSSNYLGVTGSGKSYVAWPRLYYLEIENEIMNATGRVASDIIVNNSDFIFTAPIAMSSATSDFTVFTKGQKILITGTTLNDGYRTITSITTPNNMTLETTVSETPGVSVNVAAPIQFFDLDRGALSTAAAEHKTDEVNTDVDHRTQVNMYPYLEMPAAKMALALMKGTLYGQGNEVLPPNYHVNMDAAYVDEQSFVQIGIDLWDPITDEGDVRRFVGEKKQSGKEFLETQVYRNSHFFVAVQASGALACRRRTQILYDAAYVGVLDRSNTSNWGAIDYDMPNLSNRYRLYWSYDAVTRKPRRVHPLIDTTSIDVHGDGKTLDFQLRGISGTRHTIQYLFDMFDSLRDSYSGPPRQIPVTALPSQNQYEVGDIVRLENENIRDHMNPISGTLNSSAEIQSVQIDWPTGQPQYSTFGSTRKATPISHFAADTVLDDAFYSLAAGLNADRKLDNDAKTGLTTSKPGSILLISAASIPLPGTMDINDVSTWYWYDGPVTVQSSATIVGTNNLVFATMGFLQIDGEIDGKGQGLSDPTNETPAPGDIGSTKPGGGIRTVLATYGDPNPGLYAIDSTLVEGVSSGMPFYVLQNKGTSVLGLPTSILGSPGGKGSNIYSTSSSNPIFQAVGGNGGAGGGSFISISRGVALGAGGKVDTSGDPGVAGGSAFITFNSSNPSYAGTGAGGAPGGWLALVDGPNNTADNLSSGFVANVGASEIHGDPMASPSIPIDLPSGYNYPSTYSYYTGYQAESRTNSNLRIQKITKNEAPVADPSGIPSTPLSVSAVAADNVPESLSNNFTTATVTVTPPTGDGQYDYANIYAKKTTSDAWEFVGPAKPTTKFSDVMDGSTYDIAAHSVSLSGEESPDRVLTTVTVANTTGGVNMASGNYFGVNKTSFVDTSNGIFMEATALGGRLVAGGATDKVEIDDSGNVTLTGTITATAGNIGGWAINATYITDAAGRITLDHGNARIRVENVAGTNYIDIDGNGITAIDSVLGTTMSLPTDGSAPTFASGVINSTVFNITTAGILETSANAGNGSTAGVRINDTGIKLFNSSTTEPQIFMDSSNGILNAVGAILSGSAADENLTPNNAYDFGYDGWVLTEGSAPGTPVSVANDATEGNYFILPFDGATYGYGSKTFKVIPGKKYKFRVRVDHNGAGLQDGFYFRIQQRKLFAEPITLANRDSASNFIAGTTMMQSTWTTYEYDYTIPAGVYWANVEYLSTALANVDYHIAWVEVLAYGRFGDTDSDFSINSSTFGSSGIQLGYNGGVPRAYMGDGANTFWKYEAGVLTVRTLKTSSAGKRIELNPANNNELEFYGDRGDATVEKLATIGINVSGSDTVLGLFGSGSSSRTAVKGISSSANAGSFTNASSSASSVTAFNSAGNGLTAQSTTTTTSTHRAIWGVQSGIGSGVFGQALGNGVGVLGSALGSTGVGGSFSGGSSGGPIVLTPSASASAPTHTAGKGTLWVTSAGVLYINTNGSTTWAKVGAQ